MDEKIAIRRISELETQLRELREDRNNLASEIVNYRAFLNSIPAKYPDGKEVISVYTWLNWVKKELGYDEDSSNIS